MEGKMLDSYGIKRVLEPNHVLPTSAWRVDNTREIYPNEVRIAVSKIHIESTSFRQICVETNNNAEKIKDRIMDIISKRGKLHNPVTDTGGVVFGRIEEIGPAYKNRFGLSVGDEVICNASLAAIPLYISSISNVNMTFTQVDAEGYAILFDEFPIVKKPEDIPINLLLYTFDESGTLYSAYKSAAGKKRCLVVGNSLLTNLFFGYAIRKSAGPLAEIVCLFDNNTDIGIRGKALSDLMEKTFDSIHYVNILKPVECLEKLDVGLFDVSINCADIPGAETINILSTREGGTVYFANLINNYNIALYITEAISRQIEIKCADGYEREYADFDIKILREVAPYLEKADLEGYKIDTNIGYSLRKNRKNVREEAHQASLVEDFICESKAMSKVLEEMLSVAKYDCNVLITGDTGVGKEKVSSIIQKNSTRAMQPFVKINCASISEKLIESEFFGYEKGAFTGANASGKKGYFELADNGTIFLDEVGELPLDMQAKLLRVIQDGEFYRVGGTKPVKCNVRILSATNRDLEQEMDRKLFRRDLYYRLNVFPIRVPGLSERTAEIPALVQHFLRKYNNKYGTDKTIAADALAHLQTCRWPGNIRELENTIQRLLITSKGDSITLFDVMRELHTDLLEPLEEPGTACAESFAAEPVPDEGDLNLEAMVANFESGIIRRACEKYGSTRKAARAIGISQTQLVRKKKKYGIGQEEEAETISVQSELR
ncbi:sigma-54 interaction domain-containing protein [Bacilliculturomica massiliensis]|uniref:sigma-54 interaction domain-containing protein n=1 Tax=Bacilliculturomica massiliensis TaxID=1917867 RepID=UPI001FEAA785|nr:sigma-54 dependent transcriptional regulator [Bacilliculturomica massiliensis]